MMPTLDLQPLSCESEDTMSRLMRDIQRQIHEARVRAGLSQQATAQRLGTTQQWVNKLENDAGFNPSLATLETVARALGVSLAIKLKRRA